MPRNVLAHVAACAVAAAALLVVTVVTIRARDANTRAVLLRMQAIDVPPAPKLSYSGPMYSGDGKWDLDGKTVQTDVAKMKAKRAAGKNRHHALAKPSAVRQAAVPKQKRAEWEKAAPGLAADVRTAEELVRSGKKHLSDINTGFEKAFDVQDAKVHMKRPVKVLTHV